MVICWGSPADGPAAYFVTWGTPPTKNEPWSQTSSGSSRYGFSSGFSHADALDVAAISADVRARSGPFLVFMVFLLRWCFWQAEECVLPDRSRRRFSAQLVRRRGQRDGCLLRKASGCSACMLQQ